MTLARSCTFAVMTLGLLSGCASAPPDKSASSYTNQELNEQLVMATAWMQSAAEYQALSYQAFNVARDRLDRALEYHKAGDKPLAIIVDADETIIDNSAFEAYLVGKDTAYSDELWQRWMESRQAHAMPGAVDFLNYADQKGVAVYYITNRDHVGWQATHDTLAVLGFPQLSPSRLLLKTDDSDKQARRDQALAEHKVVLLMGDNLADFRSAYDSASSRRQAAQSDQALFGRRFILLPNPTYGAWEGALYEGDWSLTPEQKSAARKAALRAWTPPNTLP
ncbi:5'-nucleotidase, lipoprotein e(P4) family [Larsenimonas suaedae]|uniref:5'-nucleotidase, lipoprotein e(P4) family n=1 Tax=Larsenimonas suaedae TaxID=1851019 RepID=A0ABU1GX06_9GAMM|nr:5'-nucleotidase, lipoprotein e(P4) family [Larsenimonas suaedae]MCM2973101.1 5'-nucleotidase, lipoprotein e(P4) family [Larsenimonas suaedae]MDR5896538.1 5'-nucleotidase, lipoprotein e(P4) family [Larsenimonas suaedae]